MSRFTDALKNHNRAKKQKTYIPGCSLDMVEAGSKQSAPSHLGVVGKGVFLVVNAAVTSNNSAPVT